MDRIKLSIVIPCLNEVGTIKSAVDDAKKSASSAFGDNFEIIVADNGSTDGTLEVLEGLESIRVVNVPVRGYGAALHWGIKKAQGEYVLFADADLSYPFSNIERFKKALKKSPDLVLGSRLKGSIEKGSMPFLHRYLGTPVLTFLIRHLYHLPTSDCNSGMRVVKKSFYERLNMRNSGMEWASELLVKTAINDGKYTEVPIVFEKDKRNKKPHLSRWSDGWRHLKAIFLLKPQSLYPLLVVFPFLGLYLYNKSFGMSFLFFDLTFILILVLLTLELFRAAIEGEESRVSNFLTNFKLIPVSGVVSIVVGLLIFLIPESRLGTKLFLVNILGIGFMWIFLVETIKTHLINRLPDLED